MELTAQGMKEFNKILRGFPAVGIEGEGFWELDEDFFFENCHIKVLQVLSYDRFLKDKVNTTNHFVVFDVNKIKLDSKLTLRVPKGKKGIFIGKKGWQVIKWSKVLGLRRINVIEI